MLSRLVRLSVEDDAGDVAQREKARCQTNRSDEPRGGQYVLTLVRLWPVTT